MESFINLKKPKQGTFPTAFLWGAVDRFGLFFFRTVTDIKSFWGEIFFKSSRTSENLFLLGARSSPFLSFSSLLPDF